MKFYQGLSFIVIASFLSCSHQNVSREVAQQGSPVPFLPGKTSPLKPKPSAHKQPSPNAAFAPAISLPSLSSLNSEEQFYSAATLSEGFIKGAVVKFIIDNRSDVSKVYFINGNYKENDKTPEYVQYHYYFAQNQLNANLSLDQFNNSTYFTNDLKSKKFIAGTLQKYNILQNSENVSFYGIQFYPQDYISDGSMFFAAKAIKNVLNIPDATIKVVSSGSQQRTISIVDQLKDLNIEATAVDKIYAGIPFIPMQNGTAYGYLRLNPKGEALDNLMPTDIPVFDELPLDLSVVSGVITTIIQDAGSHVNLKSKERHTPNMVLRDPHGIQNLQQFDGKPVKLVVDGESYSVTPSTAKQVTAEYNKKNKSKKWIKIVSGNEKALISFDQAAVKSKPFELVDGAKSYGGKAAKLMLLAHNRMAGVGSSIQKKMGYRLTPIGFGVPVTAYQNFVNSNPTLKQKIQNLVEAEMGIKGKVPPSPKQRLEAIKEIQSLFYQTELSSEFAQQLAAQVQELQATAQATYPKSKVKKLKIRSSATAEDIPHFDGAGLHSSFSAEIDNLGDPKEVCKVVVSQDGVTTKEEVEPETILCAVKGVFASLWNKRAVEERNFAKIDQSSAVMGLAINTNYDFRKKTEVIKEIANAVLVTRIINTRGVYGYRLSVNTDENLVTNPTPGTQTEIIYASFANTNEAPQFSFIQYAKTDAKEAALDKPLLAPDVYSKMIEIARSVETSYCRNISSYYPGKNCNYVTFDVDKPSSLDMEFKIYSNGEVLLKQAREFSGR